MAPLDFDEDVEEGEELLADPEPEPEPEPVVLEVLEGVPSADDALAAAWNAANDLFAVGLMAKTMPCSQWLYHRWSACKINGKRKTVPCLLAVEPEGGCRVHRDGKGGDSGRIGGHRLVTRGDATGHGLARRGKR